MGCCATKSRVLKGDEVEQPVPLPSSRWNNETVDEATKAQNNVDVKGKDVHQTNKRRSLSNLFKEEEMQMLAKTNDTQESMEPEKIEPEMHASTESEIIRKKMMQRQSSKANHEIEHHADPTEHNKRPKLAYIAPENYESSQSIDTKSIPEDNVIANKEIEDPAKAIKRNYKPDLVYVAPGIIKSLQPIAKQTPEEVEDTEKLNEVKVITNQEIEEPEQPIELIDKPVHVLVAPVEIEPRQSTEAKSAPKVIVEEMEEPAKPMEQIHESDPVLDVAPKASINTEKLEKANVTTNQKFKGPEDLGDHKGDPIDGFPGNIVEKSETGAAEDNVKPTKII